VLPQCLFSCGVETQTPRALMLALELVLVLVLVLVRVLVRVLVQLERVPGHPTPAVRLERMWALMLLLTLVV